MNLKEWNKFKNINVLIVDDDAFNRDILYSLLLKIPNINIFEAENGKKALDIIKNSNNHIGIVILDVHMPVMDGFQTLEAIQNDSQLKNIPVIMVASNHDEKIKALQEGAKDIVSKPFVFEILEEKIYSHYQEHITEKDNKKQILTQRKDILEKLEELKNINSSLNTDTIEEIQKKIFEHIISLSEYKIRLLVISAISFVLSKKLGYDIEEAKKISYTTLFKDIGLIIVDNDKDYSKLISLTDDILSQTIQTELIKMTRRVIKESKEYYNGKGYPNGLKGDQISMYSYIAAGSDLFYKLVTPIEEYNDNKKDNIIETILFEQGRKLHPDVAKQLSDNYDDFIKLVHKVIQLKSSKDNK